MRHGSSPKALFCLLGAAGSIALAGCDSSSDSSSGSAASSTAAPASPARTKESGDPLPKLDRGWVPIRSRSGGFALARPPGWSAKRAGSALTVLAPDRLVAVTVSADRSAAGLAITPADYATRAARSLPGYRKPPKPSKPRPFKHHYRGSQVVARATARNGIPQELRVVVLRRPGLVTFTAVIARNAKRHDAEETKQALDVVGTVRSRPAHEKSKQGDSKSKDGDSKSKDAGKKPAKHDGG